MGPHQHMRFARNRGNRACRGGVLVMSLIAVSIVVFMAAAFGKYVSTVLDRQAGTVDRKRAFYMAEAGLAESFSGVLCGRSGNVGSETEPALFGHGLFWVEAVDLGDGLVQIDSVGMFGRARCELSLVVQRGQKSVVDLGLLSGGDLEVPAGSLIDGYDSSLGPYAVQAFASARLMTGGELRVSNDARVEGERVCLPSGLDVPPIHVPPVKYVPGGTVDSPFPMVVPPSTLGFRTLIVATDSELVLQGPSTLVIDTLELQPGAELVFDTSGGDIRLHVTEALAFAPESYVTTPGENPRGVMLFAPRETDQAVALRATSAFHGIVYAPETTVIVSADFEVFGSLGARQLVLEGPVRLHYDRKLITLADELERPRVLSWRIDGLDVRTGPDGDPFDHLGVARGLLPSPADARADQRLEIRYFDSGGRLETYAGPESEFDWDLVHAVVEAKRDGTAFVLPARDRFQRWGAALGIDSRRRWGG